MTRLAQTLTRTIHRGAQHVVVGPDVLNATVTHLVVLIVLREQAMALSSWRGLRICEAGRAAAATIHERVVLRHWQLVLLLRLGARLDHVLIVQSCKRRRGRRRDARSLRGCHQTQTHTHIKTKLCPICMCIFFSFFFCFFVFLWVQPQLQRPCQEFCSQSSRGSSCLLVGDGQRVEIAPPLIFGCALHAVHAAGLHLLGVAGGGTGGIPLTSCMPPVGGCGGWGVS